MSGVSKQTGPNQGQPGRRTEVSPEMVRDLSEAVYRIRLSEKDTAQMIEEAGAAKLRERAGSLDGLTRAYLQAFASAGL